LTTPSGAWELFRVRSLVCAAWLGLSLAACGGGSNAPADAGVTPPPSACAKDSRADTYVAGLQKTGTNLSVSLVDSMPSPPVKGTNAWTIEVKDMSGAPLDGATIVITPFMPDHNHGTSVTPVVSPKGGGSYGIANLYLFMPGLWQVTIDVTPMGSTEHRTVVYNICVDG
jgi:hypothetical protein